MCNFLRIRQKFLSEIKKKRKEGKRPIFRIHWHTLQTGRMEATKHAAGQRDWVQGPSRIAAAFLYPTGEVRVSRLQELVRSWFPV